MTEKQPRKPFRFRGTGKRLACWSCSCYDWVLSLSIQPDHVHLFVSAPPRLAPAQIVNLFKGVSSKKLLEKFPHLRTREGLWSRTYYVGSVGTVSEETIRRYIEECQDM
ncbi:transposase [Thermotoga maritima MSB8]|uniref:Transposase n=2 Tax=Thermotoga TaxID=2335 RepID=Q9WXQ5_THEMA|nr:MULTISPECIES: IS200/IS605 family transposase [Thermotoga]AIY88211.1 transposase IS200-family protein [Thermotoga sp. Cell2]KHC96886.1 transposase IS200-family protein [Thermotoga sp. Xyl54]AAD35143.1 transposase [Thermotoga maritima MSB8]ADA66774.1 transposase IS200-family protein [Thermotoga petrophila RKU-10]AKE25995.1 transposase [Thermotoga maritima]